MTLRDAVSFYKQFIRCVEQIKKKKIVRKNKSWGYGEYWLCHILRLNTIFFIYATEIDIIFLFQEAVGSSLAEITGDSSWSLSGGLLVIQVNLESYFQTCHNMSSTSWREC